MSTAAERRAENAYETRADKTGGEIPSGDVHDNSYAIQGGSRAGPGAADDEYVVPVKTDEEALADDPDPVGKMSGQEANSDAMLGMFYPHPLSLRLYGRIWQLS